MTTVDRRHLALRWATLVVVCLAIAFTYLAGALGIGEDQSVVTARYPSSFMPAGYAFSIWGVIYASFIAFCVVQLQAPRRRVAAFDRLDIPLMIANLLGAAWIAVFRFELIVLSNVVIFAMLAVAIVMAVQSHRARSSGEVGFAFTVPFALLLGWISCAAIANTSVTLVALGWSGGALGPSGWAVVMLAVAAALGLAVGVAQRQFVVPAVVAWAAFAIWVADRHVDDVAARAAFVAGVVTGIAAIALALRSLRQAVPHAVARA